MSDSCDSCRRVLECYFCRPDSCILGYRDENTEVERMKCAMTDEDYICMLCRETQEEIVKRKVSALIERDQLQRSVKKYEDERRKREKYVEYDKMMASYNTAHSTLEEALKDLCFLRQSRDFETFTDVTFIFHPASIGDSDVADPPVRLHAHRFILAGKSDVFQAMFTSSMMEEKTGEILLTDASFPTMEAVLKYCYTANIHFDGDVLPQEVLKQAHKYQLRQLQDICETQLLTSITEQNLPEMLRFSRTYEISRLEEAALQFFRLHFKNVAPSLLDDVYGA